MTGPPGYAWRSTALGSDMCANVNGRWRLPRVDLALGPALRGTTRLHLRIYDGETPSLRDDATSRAPWSIAGIRCDAVFEHMGSGPFVAGRPFGHTTYGWREPQFALDRVLAAARERRAATGEEGFVGRLFRVDLGTAGLYQGHWFDGQASSVELAA